MEKGRIKSTGRKKKEGYTKITLKVERTGKE